jgi:hypothetical protein
MPTEQGFPEIQVLFIKLGIDLNTEMMYKNYTHQGKGTE